MFNSLIFCFIARHCAGRLRTSPNGPEMHDFCCLLQWPRPRRSLTKPMKSTRYLGQLSRDSSIGFFLFISFDFCFDFCFAVFFDFLIIFIYNLQPFPYPPPPFFCPSPHPIPCLQLRMSLMARWVVGSILHGVNPLSYFSFQPVLHNWCMCYPVCGTVHIK